MRLACVLAVALIGCTPAFAQTSGQRQPFTDSDYEAYFTDGVFNIQSPTFRSLAIGHHSPKAGMLTYFEVMPKWHPKNPYPFVKIKTNVRFHLGAFDRKRNVRVYRITKAEFDIERDEVWLSRDTRMSISPGDIGAGSMRAHNRAGAIAAGGDPEAADALYRASVVGEWTLRCAFITPQPYEVECVNVHVDSGYRVVRRFHKQADGLS